MSTTDIIKEMSKTKFRPPTGIRIQKSPVEGYGVFATRDFLSRELIEECPYVVVKGSNWGCLNRAIKQRLYKVELFREVEGIGPPSGTHSALVLGYAMIYNHSKDANINFNHIHDHFNFITNRRIEAGEELFIDYGVDYDYEKNFKKVEK